MAEDLWIVVPNWDKFQHYSDRDPVWIKLYTELNSSDAWCDLSDAERGLLVTIWIEFARSRGHLKASRIPAKVGQKSRKGQLERLNHAGWLTFSASKPLALARARARSQEKRREEKRSVSRQAVENPKLGPAPQPAKRCPDCGEKLGYGHLESCPRMPTLAGELVHRIAKPL